MVRPPLMCAIWGRIGPLYLNDALVRRINTTATKVRDLCAEGNQEAVLAYFFGAEAKSFRDADKLINSLPDRRIYRADFGPYVPSADMDTKSPGKILRFITTGLKDAAGKEWGDVRIAQDVTEEVGIKLENRVHTLINGERYGFDQNIPGLKFAGSLLEFQKDLRKLEQALVEQAQYAGAKGNSTEMEIDKALKELRPLAQVMDTLWMCGMYLMRLSDHTGFKTNAALAETFGRPSKEIDAMTEKNYHGHYYPSEDRQAMLAATEMGFKKNKYYFETFSTLTDHVDAKGDRISKDVSWDRFHPHHDKEAKVTGLLSGLGLTPQEAQAAAKADFRIGLEEKYEFKELTV